MPPREWKFRIEDILESVAKIQRYTAALTFDQFSKDSMVIDAVVRNFTIMGEATRYVPESVQAKYPEIRWDSIRGMRNVVVHQYENVDVDLTWDVIHRDLPTLVPQLQRILDDEPPTIT